MTYIKCDFIGHGFCSTLGAIISALSNLHWSTFAATSRKNRYDGTKSNFVAILQLNVSNKNAIDLCPVC